MLANRLARALEALFETVPITLRGGAPIYRYPTSHADTVPYVFVDATLGQEHPTGSGRHYVLAKVEIHSPYNPNDAATSTDHATRVTAISNALSNVNVLTLLTMLGEEITVLEMTVETLRPRYAPGRVISTIELVALVS